MKRRWMVLGLCVAIAIAVGFQQPEPLDELRQYGYLNPGVGNVGADGYSFDPYSADKLVESIELLARCPSVRRLDVPRMTRLKECLARIAKFEHILSICMRRTDAGDDDLAALAGMKSLKFLDLSRNPTITDAGVAALAGLENLRYLDLTNTKVTGTGLKDRADMVSLYQLTLIDCPVTDESLAAIPRFPKLEELLLGGTEVTDTGLMGLVGWHSLRRVLWSDRMTIDGQHAFNAAFLAARRKAREEGVPMDPRDIPPIFFGTVREPQ